MQEHEKIFSRFLAKKGLRLTLPRKQILDAVFSLHSHFDAEQLYDVLRIRNAEVSLATIYRTLPLLLESGLIQHSMRQESRDMYEHIFGHPRHLHWICRQCGAVSETSLDAIMPYLEQAAREQHFELEDYSLNLMGLCWRCKNENGSQ
ncbi:MAG TPA: transcriptional repressor [Candidatus Cloacimonetes bacterium]|jgi:Fur family ferric uptake transcriptional regulator|nr:hypothetical protein [Candidatus Cloacimonas sp.]HHZ15073.1 transcriptional repressor [Candidatus Cloacimonadota bacterium]